MSSSKNPLVSVGIPVFNGESYIQASLDSILKQSYPHLEIIISDDQSTDASYQMLQEYARSDNRIKLIQQKKRIGSINNFNFVLKKAQGTYFFWSAQDDIHDTQFVKQLLEKMECDKSITLAMSNYRNVHKNKTYKIYDEPTHALPTISASLNYFLKTHNLSLFYGLYQIEMLKAIGGYHTDWRPYFKSSDFLMIYKTLLLGKLAFVRKILFFKRDSGLYTDEYAHLKTKPFSILSKHILRYGLFPIHYVFDYYYGIIYLLKSDLKIADKIRIIWWLSLCTIRLFGSYILKSVKGVILLLQRFIRL